MEVLEETRVCVDNEGNWESEEDGTESDTDESDGSEACSFDNDCFNAIEYEDDGDHGDGPNWQSIINFNDHLFVAFSKAFQ